MSRHSEVRVNAPASIDALLQDSYLLVVTLREGRAAHHGRDLWRRCIHQVETLRHELEARGMSQRSIDCISYAQCALLDETVLAFAQDDDHADWAGEPLQVKFFNRHQAGHFLYEDMHDVLREPSPDPWVLTAYHRVLLLGFKGRYDLHDPEREGLLRALEERVPPLAIHDDLSLGTGAERGNTMKRWLRGPAMQVLAMTVLVAGAWWGLDQYLARLVASLLPGAV